MTLWKLMRSSAILATIDEYFARDWNKVLVVPYVAHAFMTKWRKEPLPPTKELAVQRPMLKTTTTTTGTSSSNGLMMTNVVNEEEDAISRNITFFFRGGILHGVDCKRKVRSLSLSLSVVYCHFYVHVYTCSFSLSIVFCG
jgi:hypothetical protein